MSIQQSINASLKESFNPTDNCINPGPVNTKMRLAAFPAENKEKIKPPEDKEILAPYVYLLSDASINVSGKSINAQ